MRELRSIAWIFCAAMVAGCGAAPPAGSIEVTPTEYDPTTQSQTVLSDGAPIDLVRPPQGGFVLFVGARARNVDEQTVEIDGRLKDASGNIVAEDVRTVAMVPAADDPSVKTPDLRSYTSVANIAVCPSNATTDQDGQPVTLEVVITEKGSGRSGSGSLTVVPSCRQTDPMTLQLCQCECAANFMLGKCGAGGP